MVRGAYVAPDLTAMGLDAPNPKEPTAFLRKAELILDKLDSDDLKRMLGTPLFRSPPDPRVHRKDLEPEVRALRKTLEQLAKVRRRMLLCRDLDGSTTSELPQSGSRGGPGRVASGSSDSPRMKLARCSGARHHARRLLAEMEIGDHYETRGSRA